MRSQKRYGFALAGSVVAVLLYVSRFRLGGYLDDPRFPVLLVYFLPSLVAYAPAHLSFGAFRVHGRSLAAIISRDLGPRIGALLFSAHSPTLGGSLLRRCRSRD